MRGESPAPDDQRCPPQILDGCPLSFLFILSTATPPTFSPPASIPPHAQVPVGGGDAFAPVAGGPGQFRSVQSAEEAGDLILGPAELEWNEQLGAGQPDNTDPLPENAAAPDAPRTASDSLYVPAALNCHLREYQRDGVRFLYTLWASGKGGVLADDMGLGKTIQTVAFLAAVLRSPKANPDPPQALVVCPMSVLENWEIELSRWGRMLPGGEFSVERVHGQSRDDAWTRVVSDNSRCEIVLTTYDTLVRNADAFSVRTWSACIFDEAHQLKNDKTKRYEAAASVQRRRRFGLSGTVMQNSYDELWCLFDWACPNSLGGAKEFKDYYSKAMQAAQRHGVDDFTLGRGRDKAEQLAKLLRKYMLKRTKKDTLADQLPQKADNVVFCDMSPMQTRVTKRLLEMEEFQLLIRHQEDCDCGSGEKRARCCYQEPTGPAPIWNSYDHSIHVTKTGALMCPYCMTFTLMQTLIKVSNHLELLKPDPEDEHGTEDAAEKFNKARVVARAALGEDADLVGGADHPDMDFTRLGDATNCGKLLALEKLLALWHRQRDKVLLFSTSTRLLTVLEKFLTQRGYVYARLDGSTAGKDRQKLVDDFNASESLFVFLLSTGAGGVGLNITSANRVVIFDPNWNPAKDAQAQDRAYRIGQRRDVDVYRLLAAGTIEEMVYQRQVYKQQQSNVAVDASKERRYFEGVQGDKANQGELFGLSNMFALANDEITRMQSLVERERRSAAESHTFEIKSAAQIEAEARARANEKMNDAAREDGEGTQPTASADGGWRRASGGSSGRGGHKSQEGNKSQEDKKRARVGTIEEDKGEGDERDGGGDEREGRVGNGGRMFTRDGDNVVHEHRHENIVGDDGPRGRETARSRRAVAVARHRGYDAEAEQRERDEQARVSANVSAGQAAERRAGATEETRGADDVVAALASFEGMAKSEMAAHLAGLTTGGRAALLSRFLNARGAGVDTVLNIFN